MKPFLLSAMVLVLLLSQKLLADVIPDDAHYVDKCAKITNIDEYENLYLLGYVNYVGAEHENTYKILSSDCLTKGYKLNSLQIYAVHTSNIDSLDINKLDLPNLNYALKSNIDIEPYAGYYPNSDPTKGIQEFYKIMGFNETSVVLHLYKKVTTYNNGNSDLVEEFSYSGNTELLSQAIPLVIPNNFIDSRLSIFPNPPVDKLYIKAERKISSIKINLYTVSGKKIVSETLSKTSTNNNFILPIVNLEKGIYLIEVNLDGAIETRKIVIK